MAKNVTNDLKPNIIATGTIITGDIQSDGDFRIDGTLKGTIESKGRVVVGHSGYIEGQIICENADISGKLKANLNIRKLVSLKKSSSLEGDIITNQLAIEPGAHFTGSCTMQQEGTPQKTHNEK